MAAGGLLGLVMLGFWIWAIVDAALVPNGATRLLPKWAWIVAIVLLWVFGAAAWFLVGRPKSALGFAGGHPAGDAGDGRTISDRERRELERREYYRRMDEELDRRLEERRGENGPDPDRDPPPVTG